MKLETLTMLFNGTAKTYPMTYSEAKARFTSVDGVLYCVSGDGSHSKPVTEAGYIQRWELFKALDVLDMDKLLSLSNDTKLATEDWLKALLHLILLMHEELNMDCTVKIATQLCALDSSKVLLSKNSHRFVYDRLITLCAKANTDASNYIARRCLDMEAQLEGATLGTIMSRYYKQPEESEDLALCLQKQALSLSYFEKLCIGGGVVAAMLLAFLLATVTGAAFAQVFGLAVVCLIIFLAGMVISAVCARRAKLMYAKAENILEYWDAADTAVSFSDVELFQRAMWQFRRTQSRALAAQHAQG